MLLQTAVSHVAAVAGQYLGQRAIGDHAIFVRIPEDELARLQRRARAGRRILAAALDSRLGQPVAIAEVVVGVIERRDGLEIEHGEKLDAWACGDEFFVLGYAPGMLGRVSGE